MDQHTRNNWKKVKAALEKTGQTDSMFYKRASAITSGKRDPFSHEMSEQNFQED